jgi:hypothetical protein
MSGFIQSGRQGANHERAACSCEVRDPGNLFLCASSLAANVEISAQQFEWGCIGDEGCHSHATSGRSSIREECHTERSC